MKQKLLLLFLPLFFVCGLRAQTHFPIYNPNYHYGNDTDATEQLTLSWGKALNQAQKQLNASNADFNRFIQYNQTYIDSERSAVYPQVKAGKLTSANTKNYIAAKTQKLVAMYNSFSNNYKNNQVPKVAPSFTVPTCDSACTNMDFSTGDFTGWYGYYEVNSSNFSFNLTGQTGGYLGAVTKACYDPNTSSYQMHITQFGQFDWFLKSNANILMSQVSPWGTGHSVMLGDSTGINYGVAKLEQEFQVTPTTNSITYAYSILIENPLGHSYYEQPFFSVTLLDSSGDTITNCGKYFVSAGPGLPGFKGIWGGGDSVYWRNWTQVNVSLSKYIGQCVTIEFLVADCALGGHFGYAYVDASCEPFVIKPATPGGLICHHGTLTLDGPFGGSAYRWFGPKGGIVGVDTDYDVSVDSVGTYTLVLTPAQGELCKDTLTYTVKGYDSLKATAAVNNPIHCFGGVGTAIATAVSGRSPYTYLWTVPGGTNAIGTGLSAGTYYVTVSDSNTCSATASVIMTQPTQLTATVKITPITCGNGNRTATVTAGGGSSPYTYTWAPGGKTSASISGPGNYTVTVTDSAGCTATAAANIVQPGPPVATISNINNVSCNGGVGSATVAVSGGSAPFTYSWNPGGQTTATANGLGAGSYTVTVKDTNGCTASAKAVITQPAVLIGTISVVYPLCNGGTGSVTVTASGGTPAYKYVWTPGGQTTAAVAGLTAASYSVKITDSKGCTGSVSVTMTQPATLAVTASFSHASCGLANGTATATVTGGTPGYNYLWSPGSQTGATANNLLAGSYTVKVTDSHNCIASASVTVTQPSAVQISITGTTNVTCNGFNNGRATTNGSGGTGPYGYQWSPAGGTGATGTGLTAGKYVVTIKDANGCTATAGTVITQPAALAVTISGAQIRCLGNSSIFTANVTGGTAPYVYSWGGPPGSIGSPNSSVTSLTPPSSTTYTVTITDANGCKQYGYITFTFPPPLAVTISGASVTCSKRTANLCALATGGTGGDTYLWEPINLSSPCVTIPASVTTIYTITVSDNCGVSATASATVDVQPPPAVSFVSNSTQGCAPLCVQLVNTTPPTGGKEVYEWNFGDGDSLQSVNPIYCYTKAGTYNVSLTVISDSGCSSTLKKIGLINVYGPPKAAFVYSPQAVTILTPTVDFRDVTTDSYGIAYRWWNFGDGSDSVSHAANAVHTYQDTGRYCIELIDMNEKGCADTVTNCLIIEPQYSLYIPSAFSPNGDGLNDVFKPVGEYLTNFDMYIFDRWGMEIYHTTDITKGWNGAIHGVGSICQEDVYIYKITVTDAQYNQHSYIGNVTLVK